MTWLLHKRSFMDMTWLLHKRSLMDKTWPLYKAVDDGHEMTWFLYKAVIDAHDMALIQSGHWLMHMTWPLYKATTCLQVCVFHKAATDDTSGHWFMFCGHWFISRLLNLFASEAWDISCLDRQKGKEMGRKEEREWRKKRQRGREGGSLGLRVFKQLKEKDWMDLN